MNPGKLLLLSVLLIILTACSDQKTENETTDHPWETQVQALEKAKDVEGMLQDASNLKRQAIDEEE